MAGKTEVPALQDSGIRALRQNRDRWGTLFKVRRLSDLRARLPCPPGTGPSCPGRDRPFLGLGHDLHLAPVRALQALRVPDIELPVDEYVAPTPRTGLELPHYHVLTPFETLRRAGGPRARLLPYSATGALPPGTDAPGLDSSQSPPAQPSGWGHVRSGLLSEPRSSR